MEVSKGDGGLVRVGFWVIIWSRILYYYRWFLFDLKCDWEKKFLFYKIIDVWGLIYYFSLF